MQADLLLWSSPSEFELKILQTNITTGSQTIETIVSSAPAPQSGGVRGCAQPQESALDEENRARLHGRRRVTMCAACSGF